MHRSMNADAHRGNGGHDALIGISSMATRDILAELAQAFARRTGQRVEIESVGGVDAARRVRSGEPFDFVVLASDAIDELVALGHLEATRRVDVARSRMAIAIKAGAPRPDVRDERGVREAVLAARAIGCSTGPSGAHVARLFERWRITDLVGARVVQAPPGVAVGTLVANGNVELGFQQLSELMHLTGIEVIPDLPAGVQLETTFSAAACSSARHPEATGALLAFLASDDADEAKRRHGMEPARSRGALGPSS
jgi:molybdate transport system substrate-binding protein